MSSAPAAVERVIARCLEKESRAPIPDCDGRRVRARRGRRIGRRPRADRRSARSAIAAAGVLSLAILAWRLGYAGRAVPSTEPPLAAPRMTPFLSTDAIEKQPAWSPTGDLIAYVSDASGNDDIWIADASGGKSRQPHTVVRRRRCLAGVVRGRAEHRVLFGARRRRHLHDDSTRRQRSSRRAAEVRRALHVQSHLGARRVAGLHRVRCGRHQAGVSHRRLRRRSRRASPVPGRTLRMDARASCRRPASTWCSFPARSARERISTSRMCRRDAYARRPIKPIGRTGHATAGRSSSSRTATGNPTSGNWRLILRTDRPLASRAGSHRPSARQPLRCRRMESQILAVKEESTSHLWTLSTG